MPRLIGSKAVGHAGVGGRWPGGPTRQWSTAAIMSGFILFPLGYASPHFLALPVSGYQFFSVLFVPWAVLGLVITCVVIGWIAEQSAHSWRFSARESVKTAHPRLVVKIERAQRITLGLAVVAWGMFWYIPWAALIGGSGLHSSVFSPQVEPLTLWIAITACWPWVVRQDRALLRLECWQAGRCRVCQHQVHSRTGNCPECGSILTIG